MSITPTEYNGFLYCLQHNMSPLHPHPQRSCGYRNVQLLLKAKAVWEKMRWDALAFSYPCSTSPQDPSVCGGKPLSKGVYPGQDTDGVLRVVPGICGGVTIGPHTVDADLH